MTSSADSSPRLLVLSNEAPRSDTAGGIFFSRLLADYPPDRLRVVTNRLPPPHALRLRCEYNGIPLALDRLNQTRFWPWKARLRALGAGSLVRLSRIDRAVGDFQPDIIVTLMQDSCFYDVAARYAAARRLPLVLFVHDVPSGFEPVAPLLHRFQRALDRRVYRQAVARLCVSRGMIDYFRREFNADAELLLPPRSEQPPAQDPENCRTLKSPGRLTLGYAGGLHYGYGEQLLRMIPALRATGTRVEVFSAPPSGTLSPLREADDVFRFNGFAASPEDAWSTLLARCDAVLQPYLNPPGPHEAQYRTHFPSKLGDALSLGLPLLVTGPAYASGHAWCAAHPGCAVVLPDPSTASLENVLVRLRDDAALRVSTARAALQAATDFDIHRLREQFRSALRNVLQGQSACVLSPTTKRSAH